MITAKSYRSQVKRGISSPSANSLLIYINDRHFSRIMQDTQLTTHTAPPNAAPYASQRISENNIQQQRNRIIVSHLSTASRYLRYLDSTVITRPQIKLWQIQENKSAFLEKRILFPDHHERKIRGNKLLLNHRLSYLYRQQASHQTNALHTVAFIS